MGFVSLIQLFSTIQRVVASTRKEKTMLISRNKSTVRKRVLPSDSRGVLSLITDEKRKGNITDAQAEALQRQAMTMYFTEYLQNALEPSFEGLVDQMQRLEGEFDHLVEYVLQMEGE